MFKYTLIFLLLMGGLFASPQPYQPDREWLLVVCAGQSNTLGQSSAIEPSAVKEVQDDSIYIYEYGNAGGAGDISQPTKVRDAATVRHGPARPLARRLRELFPDRNICILKIAYGGTGLYDADAGNNWSVSGNGARWVDLKSKTDDCISKLEVFGDTVTDVCLVWYQGDRDAQEQAHADAYSANLQALVNGYRSHLARSAAQLPVVITQTHSINPEPYVSTVQAQQAAAVAAFSNAVLLDVDAVATVGVGDGTHLLPSEYEAIGRLQADAVATFY